MASSLLAEQGWSIDAIERQLAHVESGKESSGGSSGDDSQGHAGTSETCESDSAPESAGIALDLSFI
jgi:hypothetical protein